VADSQCYLDRYEDLRDELGDTNVLAANIHWYTDGIEGGRTFGCELSDRDAQCYIDRYPELVNAFGTNVVAAKRHWYVHGKEEGRIFECDTPPENLFFEYIIKSNTQIKHDGWAGEGGMGRLDYKGVVDNTDPRVVDPIRYIDSRNGKNAYIKLNNIQEAKDICDDPNIDCNYFTYEINTNQALFFNSLVNTEFYPNPGYDSYIKTKTVLEFTEPPTVQVPPIPLNIKYTYENYWYLLPTLGTALGSHSPYLFGVLDKTDPRVMESRYYIDPKNNKVSYGKFGSLNEVKELCDSYADCKYFQYNDDIKVAIFFRNIPTVDKKMTSSQFTNMLVPPGTVGNLDDNYFYTKTDDIGEIRTAYDLASRREFVIDSVVESNKYAGLLDNNDSRVFNRGAFIDTKNGKNAGGVFNSVGEAKQLCGTDDKCKYFTYMPNNSRAIFYNDYDSIKTIGSETNLYSKNANNLTYKVDKYKHIDIGDLKSDYTSHLFGVVDKSDPRVVVSDRNIDPRTNKSSVVKLKNTSEAVILCNSDNSPDGCNYFTYTTNSNDPNENIARFYTSYDKIVDDIGYDAYTKVGEVLPEKPLCSIM
jgi:hypothetical protein